MENVSIDHATYMHSLRLARAKYPGLSDENAMTFYVKGLLEFEILVDDCGQIGVSQGVKQGKK